MSARAEVLAEALYLAVMEATRDFWPHFSQLPEPARQNWLRDAEAVLTRIDSLPRANFLTPEGDQINYRMTVTEAARCPEHPSEAADDCFIHTLEATADRDTVQRWRWVIAQFEAVQSEMMAHFREAGGKG